MSPSSSEHIRTPQQQRSLKRTEQILEAARVIIRDKGYANLTISEIAAVAGITAGSMYQYFRNKSAIVLALAQGCVDQFNQEMQQIFAHQPKSRDELEPLMLALIDSGYRLYRSDPVIRDIWLATATDKDLQDLDRQDLARTLSFLLQVVTPFFPATAAAELERTLALLCHYSTVSIHLALEQTEAEGELTIGCARQLIASSWQAFITRQPL